MCDIVIADDEHLEREVLKRIISNVKGARTVAESKTGQPAVEYCASLMPHMIFLNCAANGAGGLEAAWKIRKNDQRIAIVLTTADERFLLRHDFSAININEFLQKPIRPAKIDEIVRKYTRAVETKKAAEAAEAKKDLYSQVYTPTNKAMYKEISDALSYINANFMKNLSLEEVADTVYLSTSYLSRLFKKEVGVNFSSYLLLKKLEEAKRLLKETDMSVMRISGSLSFSDPSYFCRVFKKHINQTPKEFRIDARKI